MCVLRAEQQWINAAVDSAEKLRAQEQAALDQRVAEHEAAIQNRPARTQFNDGKRLGLQHKLCRFLLKFADDNKKNCMSSHMLISRGKKAIALCEVTSVWSRQ